MSSLPYYIAWKHKHGSTNCLIRNDMSSILSNQALYVHDVHFALHRSFLFAGKWDIPSSYSISNALRGHVLATRSSEERGCAQSRRSTGNKSCPQEAKRPSSKSSLGQFNPKIRRPRRKIRLTDFALLRLLSTIQSRPLRLILKESHGLDILHPILSSAQLIKKPNPHSPDHKKTKPPHK